MFQHEKDTDIERFKELVDHEKEQGSYGYWKRFTEVANKEWGEDITWESWRTRYKKYVLPTYSQKETLEETKKQLLKLIKREKSVKQLETYLDKNRYEVLGLIEDLKLRHHNIQVFKVDGEIKVKIGRDESPEDEIFKIATYANVENEIKLGVISDTHLCSKYQQLELLNKAYDHFQAEGIDTVLHAGDISDGFYKERLFSIFKLGFDEQADYIAATYPKRDGITTYFLTGNHDETHERNGGADIGKVIADKREDMVYLGPDRATININGCDILLMHPKDGSSYAYSYRGQKHLDVIRGGKKPDMVLCGHHHKLFYMLYRNVHYYEVPSFQDRTRFTDGKGLSNDVGYWIITAKLNEKGKIISTVNEARPFYETKKNDYNNKFDNFMNTTKEIQPITLKK